MKTPYISKYIEEFPLHLSAPLFYDNHTQISYLSAEKEIKAYEINLGPQTTKQTERVENSDVDYLGPDTTKTTFTVEPDDQQMFPFFLDPQTTTITRTIENSDEQ